MRSGAGWASYRFCLAVPASVYVVCGGAAIAQSPAGFYVSGAAGLNLDRTSTGKSGRFQILTHPGALGTAAIGYAFGNGLRAELEGDYRSNDLSAINTHRLNGRLLPLHGTAGAARGHAFMANAFYDLSVTWALPFTPYIGVGAGYDRYDLDSATGSEPFAFPLPPLPGGFQNANPVPPILQVNNYIVRRSSVRFGAANVFAYQAIAGAAFPIAAVPGLAATLEYRYFGTAHGPVPIQYRAVPPATLGAYGKANLAMSSNSLQFGLRYQLPSPRS